MLDHVRDLESLREATERLLTAVARLDNASVAEPSRLPGWSRGHVLAHLARNADALVNVLEGRPMYPDAVTRDSDIERDAPRPWTSRSPTYARRPSASGEWRPSPPTGHARSRSVTV